MVSVRLNAPGEKRVNCLVLNSFTTWGVAVVLGRVRVDSGTIIGRRGLMRQLGIAAAGAFCAWVCLDPGSLYAGEKIKITGSDDKVSLPKEGEKEFVPPDLFPSRINPGDAGQGPSLLPPKQPILIPNRKMEQMLDQQKN